MAPELQEAVKRFQRRHGLEPDGAIGAAIVAQMNVPVDARIQQIALNLERWRWLPADLGERHILVNVPEYRLEVWERGKVPALDARRRRQEGHADADLQRRHDPPRVLALLERAARHRQERDGAVRPCAIRRFCSAPTWKCSTRAATRSIRRRSTWSTSASYRFRQRPGSSNSLGLVKFMFPNSVQRLPARHAGGLAVRARDALVQPRLRPRRAARASSRSTCSPISRNGRRSGSREAMHAGQEKTVKLTGRAAGLPRLLDGARLRRRHPAVPRRLLRDRRAPDDAAARRDRQVEVACG